MRLLEKLLVLVDASCRLAYIIGVHPIFLALDTGQSLETEELELGYSVVQGETESITCFGY